MTDINWDAAAEVHEHPWNRRAGRTQRFPGKI